MLCVHSNCAARNARDGGLTGQHFDMNMSEGFFAELGIPSAEHHFGIGGRRHEEVTGSMPAGTEDLLVDEEPDVVVMYGDSKSTSPARWPNKVTHPNSSRAGSVTLLEPAYTRRN